MTFTFWTSVEVEGAAIQWDDEAPKSRELIEAALAAGFSQGEIDDSALGTLERDLVLAHETVFKAGALTLIGINGSMLIETI